MQEINSSATEGQQQTQMPDLLASHTLRMGTIELAFTIHVNTNKTYYMLMMY